ncbi:MAG: efflux RND transporter periplasmic adaptor subunit [Deltaproteobacteria bacterium]|jgi:membrane fusion protein (multidrug efflux system)|nr:efflux RND transporter periplasmic adaptor subunit [Deltaproteobacteria bacterium]
MSDQPPAIPEPETLAKPAGGRGGPMIKTAAVFLIIGFIGLIYWFFFLRPYETTDDAYVTGNQIRITPRTGGTVMEIFADNTDTVTAGQLLVSLDPADAALALEQARYNLAEAVRQVASLQADRDRLTAMIEARQNELLLIKNEYNRRLKLKTGTSVTAEEVERFRNQTDVAGANLRAAQAQLAAARHLLGEQPVPEHPQVRAAAAKLKEAWLAFERCQIRSPVTGQVARRTVQVGSLVSAGTPLMIVVPLEDIWVDANFKENQLDTIKAGQKAMVIADLYNGKVIHKGVVVGSSAGTGSVFSLLPPENATGNWIKVVQRVPVRIALDPETVAQAPLLLGLSCRVEILLHESPAEVPPANAASRSAGALAADFSSIEKEIADTIADNLGRTLRQARELPDAPESPNAPEEPS